MHAGRDAAPALKKVAERGEGGGGGGGGLRHFFFFFLHLFLSVFHMGVRSMLVHHQFSDNQTSKKKKSGSKGGRVNPLKPPSYAPALIASIIALIINQNVS